MAKFIAVNTDDDFAIEIEADDEDHAWRKLLGRRLQLAIEHGWWLDSHTNAPMYDNPEDYVRDNEMEDGPWAIHRSIGPLPDAPEWQGELP